MTETVADSHRTVPWTGGTLGDSVVPYYMDDLNRRISIARVGDSFYAFDDLCTCAEQPCPLSGGLLAGRTLMCQCHGSRFDIATGDVIDGPATRALRVYEARKVESGVQIRLPTTDS